MVYLEKEVTERSSGEFLYSSDYLDPFYQGAEKAEYI
jgi:hypothetical protein